MKSKIPKIMYDQTQFTAVYWIDKNGLWLNEDGYNGMNKISGYAPSTWITYTQNLPESFWFGAYDEDAIEKEAEVGLKTFSDPAFLKKFEDATKKSYEMTAELKNQYLKDFLGKEKESVMKMPEKVEEFLRKIREANTFMLSHYFLTQPQRFYKFEQELKEEGLNKDTELISTNGRSLTYVSELRKAILDYTQNVLSSEISPDKYKIENTSEYGSLLKIANRLGFLNRGLLGGELIDDKHIDNEVEVLISDKTKFIEEKSKMDELVTTIKRRSDLLEANHSKAYALADIMGHSSVLRFDLQTCILCILKFSDDLLKEVIIKHGLTETELKSYEFDEVLKLVKEGVKISNDLIIKRQKGFLRVYREGDVRTYLAEDAHKEIADLLEFRKNEISQTKTLKGTVASWPDKKINMIKGKAFVLTTAFGADDVIKAMKPGEILVATQTHPALVPYMKEASAILTDEGGITCHAAIVSRELSKPCIIGTRLATKIIKMGDVIELNLASGEISIVN
jgi:phosphohistidine swiveling domain-containing protein